MGVLEGDEDDVWTGVMALRSGQVGYAPRTYLQFVEEREQWLSLWGDKSSREVQRKALKELHNQARHHTHPECAYGNMIPEPDYSDDEQAEANIKSSSAIVNRNNTFNNAISKDPIQDRCDEQGLIIPKKLVNPNLESTEKKSLHRELKFNQKAGINVLNQKTELERA